MRGKVSIIICVYNIEDYISRCLESVINQQYSNLEIIVVNDGSTDLSLEIIKSYQKSDERIKVINQLNSGLSDARNSGYQIATGEYILFIDGDDWLETNCISELYSKASYEKSDIIIYDAYKSWDSYRERMNIVKGEIIPEFNLESLFLNKFKPSIWSKFVSHEFLKKVDTPLVTGISYGEDLASVSTWFMHNPRVTYCQKCLYNYYQRENSITHRTNDKLLEVNLALYHIKKQLIYRGLFEKYKSLFDYLTYYHLFETKFLFIKNNEPLKKNMYLCFKEYRVDYKNKYILNRFREYPKLMKLRSKIYLYSYVSGVVYDRLRLTLKKSV